MRFCGYFSNMHYFALALLISSAHIFADSAAQERKKLADTYVACADKLKEDHNNNETALIYLQKAHELLPDDATIMFDLANTYNVLNHNEEALKLYYALLCKFPKHKTILYNTAYTLKKMGKIQEAMFFYDATLEIDPNYAEARFSRSLAYLVTGDFERGWKEYEWRWDRQGFPAQRFDEPLWDGKSDLNGKVVYVHSEQGLGDTFQFVRYIRELKKRGARVALAVQAPLVDIISLCPYIDRVMKQSERPVQFDYHIPLLSLPYLFQTRLDAVPKDIPYLYAKPDLIQSWKQKLSSDKGFRIGICWQGNPNYRTPSLRSVVAAKSLNASMFEPISRVPGVSIYSLQRETGTEQVSELPATFKIHVFDASFDRDNGRFNDTAAVMKNIDLMITVDTSIAHLAGGLGIPVWVLIPNPPDWRWMLDRIDTPWYPNMRLFRQKTCGNWEPVIEEIVQELRKIVPAQIAHQDAGCQLPEINDIADQLRILEAAIKASTEYASHLKLRL